MTAPNTTNTAPIISKDFQIVLAMIFIGFGIFMGWMAAWVQVRQRVFTPPTVGEDVLILLPLMAGFAALLPQTVSFLANLAGTVKLPFGRRDG
jgi:hypothetical protein